MSFANTSARIPTLFDDLIGSAPSDDAGPIRVVRDREAERGPIFGSMDSPLQPLSAWASWAAVVALWIADRLDPRG